MISLVVRESNARRALTSSEDSLDLYIVVDFAFIDK